MSDIKIESGVLPPKPRSRGLYPVGRLNPGESFTVELRQRSGLSVAIARQQIATGQRFTTRTEGDRLRVWRLS